MTTIKTSSFNQDIYPVRQLIYSYLMDQDLVHFLCVDRDHVLECNRFMIRQMAFHYHSHWKQNRIREPFLLQTTITQTGKHPFTKIGYIHDAIPRNEKLLHMSDLQQFSHLRILHIDWCHSDQSLDGLLPQTLNVLHLIHYPISLTVHSLPRSLICLNLESSYLSEGDSITLEEGVLPDTLTHLTLICYLTTPIVASTILPSSLKMLKYEDGQVDPALEDEIPLLPNILPCLLEELIIGVDINYVHSLTNVLPGALKRLELGFRFQSQLYPGDLPDSLEELVFDWPHHSLAGIVPSRLPSLIIEGVCFDEPIDTFLHPTNHTLRILKVLTEEFDSPIQANTLPVTLTTLWLTTYKLKNYRFMRDVLPPNLTELHIRTGAAELFTTDSFHNCRLEVLSINSRLFSQVFDRDILPQSLRELLLPKIYTQQVQAYSLPQSLRHIHLRADLLQGDISADLKINGLCNHDFPSYN